MVDPLVAIACDYLERVKDKTGGTLDKLVWDAFSIDERNACGTRLVLTESPNGVLVERK